MYWMLKQYQNVMTVSKHLLSTYKQTCNRQIRNLHQFVNHIYRNNPLDQFHGMKATQRSILEGVFDP